MKNKHKPKRYSNKHTKIIPIKRSITVKIFIIVTSTLVISYIAKNKVITKINEEDNILQSSAEVINGNISAENEILEQCRIVEETEDEQVSNIINGIMQEENLSEENFSFFYYNINTKKYCFYNEDKWFTAASTIKVPIAMLYYDKIRNGEITKDTTYTYTNDAYEAGDGLTAYKYSVGSKIPVSFLLEQMIVNSDNTATNILSLGLGGRKTYRSQFTKYSDVELPENFSTDNITSASFGYDIMKYLYNNSNDYEELLEYMKKSSYGEYLKKYITDYEVSHKYGSYNGYVHDYGIVYGETTYFIGIFTKNVIGADELIADISKKILDSTL